MNKKPFFLLAGAIALLFSCSDNRYEPEQPEVVVPPEPEVPIEIKSKLRIAVADLNSYALLPATVTLQGTEQEPQTIEPPQLAEFKGLTNGPYRVLAEMEGYASRVVYTSIGSNVVDAGQDIAQDKNEHILLPKMGAKMEGYLYYDKNGKSVPMANVPVQILVDYNNTYNLIEKIYRDTTDADGKYSFANLPAVGNIYKIWYVGLELDSTYGIYEVLGSAAYSLDNDAVLHRGKTSYNMALAQNNVPFTILDYKKELTYEEAEAGHAIVFKFSKEIDASKLKEGTVTVDVPANVSFAEKEITVFPVNKWTQTFTVSFNSLKSVLDQDLTGSWAYTVTVNNKNINDAVVALSLDSTKYYNAANAAVYLSWNKIEGATGYDIYKKSKNSAADYVLHTTVSDTSFIETVSNKDTTLFVVRAKNTNYTSNKFSNTIVAIDNIAPDFANIGATNVPYGAQSIGDDHACGEDCFGYINPFHELPPSDSVVNYYDFYMQSGLSLTPAQFNTTYSLTAKLSNPASAVVSYGRIFFNKQMDTTVVPTVECRSEAALNPCAKLDIEVSWNYSQNLSVIVKTKDGNVVPPGQVDVVYLIKGLKGANGVAFSTKYNTATDAKITRSTVQMRFKVEVLDPCVSDPWLAGCSCANLAPADVTIGCCSEVGHNKEPGCSAKFACQLYGTTDHDCLTYCKASPTLADFSTYCSGWDACQLNGGNSTECLDTKSPGYVFSENFEGPTYDWTITGTGLNKWVINRATYYSSGYSAYVSNNGYDYAHSAVNSTSNLYTTVTFPDDADDDGFSLSFMYKGLGDGNYHYTRVYLCPESYTVGASQPSCTSVGDANYSGVGYTNWSIVNINLPKVSYGGQTFKLVFYWVNDNVLGNDPGAIDNIEISYTPE